MKTSENAIDQRSYNSISSSPYAISGEPYHSPNPRTIRVRSPRSPERKARPTNDDRPRNSQNGNTRLHEFLTFFDGLLVVLKFNRSSSCEGDANDNGHVVEEGERPFEFLVGVMDAVGSPAVVSILLRLGNERLTLHVGYRLSQGELETTPRWKWCWPHDWNH